MRVLLTTYPEKTHFLLMTPLAWALRGAGHEVRVASLAGLTEVITQAGLTAVPIDRPDRFARMLEQDPTWLGTEDGLLKPYDTAVLPPEQVTWPHLRDGMAEQVAKWHKMSNQPLIADLVEFCRGWQPDLVIWETTTYAGAIAAQACGAAHARFMWSVDVFGLTRQHYRRLAAQQPAGERMDPLADWLGAHARRYGGEFSEELVSGQIVIDQLPESLRMPAEGDRLSMRYVPYGGAAVVPAWLRTPPARPRVALTLGLSTIDYDVGYAVDVPGILDALADLDIEVVATIAAGEQSRLRRVPDNVRLTTYVPLHALVPSCAAVIHHAGPGTLSTVALAGIPQLALPWDFDEPALAARMAAQGAGISVNATQADGPIVRDAVLRLLREPAFRQRAAALRDEMLAQPSPNDVVPRLEELAVKRRMR